MPRARKTIAARALLALATVSLVSCTGAPTPSSSAGASASVNTGASAAANAPIAVGISDAGCSPSTMTATAGQVVFSITNNGSDVAEFEIIAADKHVIDEAENIIPGFEVNLSSRLDGGTYELACGSVDAPRGTLTVSGGTAPSAPPNSVVDAATLAAVVASYKTYVIGQADDLVKVIDAFTAKVDAGDLAGAKALYGPARVPWERIEPVAELFSDIDARIDSRVDDHPGGVTDPAFLGYHRIEKVLWVDGSTVGLSTFTVDLRAAVKELRSRLDTLDIGARVMARGAGELIDEVAQSKMTGEEDRYSKLDLWSIVPNIEGSKEIVDLLRPTITTIDPAYLAMLDASYTKVAGIIAPYGDETAGFKTFDQISAADLKALQAALAELSERLAELPGRLGLQA
jgi:iron uptake system component EfeO